MKNEILAERNFVTMKDPITRENRVKTITAKSMAKLQSSHVAKEPHWGFSEFFVHNTLLQSPTLESA